MDLQHQEFRRDTADLQGWKLDIEFPESTHLLLKLSGSWAVTTHLPSIETVVHAVKTHPDISHINIDARDISAFDSGLVVWIIKIDNFCQTHNIVFNKSTLPEGVIRLFNLSKEVPPRGFTHVEEDKTVLGNIGASTVDLWHRTNDLLEIVGATLFAFFRLIVGRAIFVKHDILRFIQQAGHEAVGIVSLAAFLIGVTLAVIGISQLKKYGADVYIANIEVIGILRELGCLITGIVMAGRSASAYAAEIGAMQVHEELDALQSLAISTIDFLVMPRVIAIVFTLPILVIYANVIANLGGLLFSITVLDISYLEYINKAREAFTLTDFFIGLVKAYVFGYLIAIAGCLRGLQCGRSVSEVGDSTTSAVVLAMVLIVIANVTIDLMLYAIGI